MSLKYEPSSEPLHISLNAKGHRLQGYGEDQKLSNGTKMEFDKVYPLLLLLYSHYRSYKVLGP